MSGINDLRREVYRAQKRANAKKERLYEVNRAQIEGTQYDPVKPGRWVARASSSQLEAQLKRLKTFNSRTTQFYGDAENKPITGKTWNTLQKEVNAFNAKRADFYDSVKGIKTPSGVTVDQAAQLRTGKSVNYIDDFRTPKTVNHRAYYGEKNVLKEIKRYRQMNRKGVDGLVKSARENFLSIMLAEGDKAPDWSNRVADMPDKQFFMLWSSTDFKKLVGSNYTHFKEGITRHNEDMVTINNDSINELLDWVESPKVTRALNKKR